MTLSARIRGLYRSPIFWVVVFVVAAVLVLIRIVELERRTTRDEAARRAEIEASYDSCVRSIPLLLRVNRFVVGVQEAHEALLKNALAIHRATPRTDPQWRAQIGNIARLRDANRDVRGVHFTTPTMKQCREIRDARLHPERHQVQHAGI